MTDVVRKVGYYYVTVPDKPGEGLKVFSGLKGAGINLVAACAFPIQGGRTQIDLVPERPEDLLRAASRLGLMLSERREAFLVQGEDRADALAGVYERLAREGINVVASQATAAGAGRWGLILWVAFADYERAGKALGI